MTDHKVATTRNTRSQGEAWDRDRRLMITLEEDVTHVRFGQTQIGTLTFEWINDDDTPGGKLELGTAGIETLREILA